MNVSFQQCCDCCQLGLLAGSSGYGKQCDDAGFQIIKCNNLYKECCEFSKARKGLFNRTEGPSDDNRARTPRIGVTPSPVDTSNHFIIAPFFDGKTDRNEKTLSKLLHFYLSPFPLSQFSHNGANIRQ